MQITIADVDSVQILIKDQANMSDEMFIDIKQAPVLIQYYSNLR